MASNRSRLSLGALAVLACGDQLPPYSAATNYPIDPNPQASAVVDVNGDGKLDAVFATTSAPGQLDVLLGNNDGTLGAKTQLQGGGVLYGLAVADFNGDKHPDLASSEQLGGAVDVFVNSGTGTFAAPVTSAVGSGCNPRELVAADFNGDGKPDLAVLCDQSAAVVALVGDGKGSFAAMKATTTGGRPAVALATTDLNGDGKADLVVAGYGADSVGEIDLLLGGGNGTFGAPAALTIQGLPAIAVGDVNQDGFPDIVVRFGLEYQIIVGSAQGTYSSGLVGTFGADFDPNGLVLTDLDGDHRLDLAATNPSAGTISFVKGDGAGGFGAETQVPVGVTPTALSTGDLNGDGRPDFLTGDGTGDRAYVSLAR